MTTLTCTPSDLTRTLKIKNPTILNKSEALIADMRDAVKDLSPFDLEGHDVDWVVSHVRGKLSQESFRLDFFEWSEKYILTKTETTRRAYSCALNTFERFLGKREIDINDISRGMLLDFMERVDNEKKMHFDVKKGKLVEGKKAKIPKGASIRSGCSISLVERNTSRAYPSFLILSQEYKVNKQQDLLRVFPEVIRPSDKILVHRLLLSHPFMHITMSTLYHPKTERTFTRKGGYSGLTERHSITSGLSVG